MSEYFPAVADDDMFSVLVEAAKRGLETYGFKLTKQPGRGRSNVWEVEKGGKKSLLSMRTSTGTWFAFPFLGSGKWKTLDDVDLVCVASVDNKERPTTAQVYLFDANEVRAAFNEAVAARSKAGRTVTTQMGFWIPLHEEERAVFRPGSGLGDKYPPIAEYRLDDLADVETDVPVAPAQEPPRSGMSVKDILDRAKRDVANALKLPFEAISLELRIES